MRLTGVDLLLTFRCPSQCKHCVYKAGPQRAGHMNYENIRRWLAELKNTQPLEGITVHGGEPTVFFDTLLFAISTAKQLDIPKRGIITNGYWASTESIAQNTLRKLQQAGLTQITFSVDSFHQEFIPFEDVRRGVEAASQMSFDHIWVDSQFLELETPSNEYDIRTQKLLDALTEIPGIEISTYQVDFEGRAADTLSHLVLTHSDAPTGKCQLPYWLGKTLREPKTIEIDYEGNVTLCPGICIGNAKTTPLHHLLGEYEPRDHVIIQRLAEKGPIGLFELVKEKGVSVKQKFVDECHLCYEMRKHLRAYYPQLLQPSHCY
ncbi:MAG: radical SAM protein [Candidatus Hermodarchaeota archaeon]|nr:radical SAM protein [Candidatus Hermodarchaeota archaeon]